ncbi:Pkinase-domain-containing protein [Nadsonia fulvescens var. elongata DSM 6958]|uniref:Pkinase-domain-containing protein n=1 Tax=Nadsonia fulvescens var. elongata DSM 6958 TaxID=857566 RepID=A0A1E3PD17_9ASCO|nr:Pkinase-domain-containing protein [Nadsonia fulvescens var. elongata DSM 6958]
MDYVTGGDLMDFVTNQGPIPEAASREIILQVLNSVEYVHGLGISHRDIKPDNILIAQDDPVIVKVTDFGLAKISEAGTFLKTFCGTLAYLAPEVIAGKNKSGPNATYSSRVDMWSIGCLAYVILTGYLPFDGTTQEHLYNSIKLGQYHQSPLDKFGVSQQGQDFIKALLQIDPMTRPSATQALQLSWLTTDFATDSMVESQAKSTSAAEPQVISEHSLEAQNTPEHVANPPADQTANTAAETPVKPIIKFTRPSTFDSLDIVSEGEFNHPESTDDKPGCESDHDNDEVKHAAELECSQRQERVRASAAADHDPYIPLIKVENSVGALPSSNSGHLNYSSANSPSVPMSALALTSGVRDFDDYGEVQYPDGTYMVLQTLKSSMPFKDVYINHGEFSFGRSEANNVMVPDGRVSKIHCLIHRSIGPYPHTDREQVWLFDNAANRCWVNRVAIGKGNKVLLQDGDEVFLFFDQHNNNVFLGFRVSLVNPGDFITRRQLNGIDEVMPVNDPQLLAKFNISSKYTLSNGHTRTTKKPPVAMAGTKRPFQPMHLNNQANLSGGRSIRREDSSLPAAKRHLSMVPR